MQTIQIDAEVAELERIARKIRYQLIELSHQTETPHLGSSLSCVDLMVAAYWSFLRVDPQNPENSDRDRFILSKGHAVTTLYAVLAAKGFFPATWLDDFNRNGGKLPEHPSPKCAPGIEAATGSLGHGLSLGIGQAISARILHATYRVVVLMSDGECNEGSVWEAALFAPAQRLNNLVTVIDFNKWQATGPSEEVMMLSPLKEKWDAFGWTAYEIDGHDMHALVALFTELANYSGEKPIAIVAHTVKGKGVSFMENDNNWHYRIPNKSELLAAKLELGV